MIDPPGRPQRPATLDDLAALNREMAALVRAGLPLEESLGRFAEDFGHGPGELAARLQQETTKGKSLADAVAAQGDALPPVYRAVVDAGLKSGRLAAALEGFAESAARISDLRRITAQAWAYPLMVIVMAIAMLFMVGALVLPGYEWLELGNRVWMAPLEVSRRTALWLMLAAPCVAAVLAVIWWRRSARASASLGTQRWVRWIPGAKRAMQLGSQANFAEMLGLLVSCRVPFVDALPLAASASGSEQLRAAAAALQSQLVAGQPLTAKTDALHGLPPLVRTALLAAPHERALAPALDQAAEVYRERARSWIDHIALTAPIVATLLVGAVVTGAYALLLFQPYVAVLKEASQW